MKTKECDVDVQVVEDQNKEIHNLTPGTSVFFDNIPVGGVFQWYGIKGNLYLKTKAINGENYGIALTTQSGGFAVGGAFVGQHASFIGYPADIIKPGVIHSGGTDE